MELTLMTDTPEKQQSKKLYSYLTWFPDPEFKLLLFHLQVSVTHP